MRASSGPSGRSRFRGLVSVLLILALVACGGDDELDSLRQERLADLASAVEEGQLAEVRRSETGAGTALGKPVRAKLVITYAVEADPASALQAAADVAEEDGYTLQGPAETSQGTVVEGEKLTGSQPILLGLTLLGPEESDASGVDGPALVVSLTLGDARS